MVRVGVRVRVRVNTASVVQCGLLAPPCATWRVYSYTPKKTAPPGIAPTWLGFGFGFGFGLGLGLGLGFGLGLGLGLGSRHRAHRRRQHAPEEAGRAAGALEALRRLQPARVNLG